MFPATTQRVYEQTNDEVNEKIARATERNVAYHFNAGAKLIDRRLKQLEREWDTERVLEANAAAVSLIGLFLGATKNRSWYILPTAVSLFLMQHALQGWCPPLSVIRRLGVRTAREIENERVALKALRGDFTAIGEKENGVGFFVEKALKAARQ